MTLTGKLDYEGDTARIEGDSQASRKMLPAAAKWCAGRLKKGMIVGCELVPDGDKHGWISKIYEHKQESQTCTSPAAPAGAGLNPDVRSAPKTIKGTVSSVNAEKRIFIVEDTDGITHGFSFPAEIDVLVKKQKPGWFVEATYRTQGDRELLSDVKYAERPAGMQRKGGAGNFQPKKPRITVSATVNLQNYENIKVEVEGASADECNKILIDTLKGYAKNPAYVTTKDMIDTYLARVMNMEKGGK